MAARICCRLAVLLGVGSEAVVGGVGRDAWLPWGHPGFTFCVNLRFCHELRAKYESWFEGQ